MTTPPRYAHDPHLVTTTTAVLNQHLARHLGSELTEPEVETILDDLTDAGAILDHTDNVLNTHTPAPTHPTPCTPHFTVNVNVDVKPTDNPLSIRRTLETVADAARDARDRAEQTDRATR